VSGMQSISQFVISILNNHMSTLQWLPERSKYRYQMTRCTLNLLYIFDSTFFINKSAYLYQ